MERLAAWLYTGPIGHLYGTAADVAQLWSGYFWARLSGGDPDAVARRMFG